MQKTFINYTTYLSVDSKFDPTCTKVQAFSDTSISYAYGATIYLCSPNYTAFVMAKYCVASLKSPTLPRLELIATLVAARLVDFITNSLNMTNIFVHVWVDSQITLNRLSEFIVHGVSEINHLLPCTSWHYCLSSNNPADL